MLKIKKEPVVVVLQLEAKELRELRDLAGASNPEEGTTYQLYSGLCDAMGEVDKP